MDNIFVEKLNNYNPQNKDEYVNSLREIIQEITLYSLSKTDFFENVAFCGGTSLRIFYSLDRASEDLDFSLTAPKDFNLSKYLDKLETDFKNFGFSFNAIKNNNDSNVDSAFLKGNTIINLISIGIPENLIKNVRNNELLKIKIEVDTCPPSNIEYEYKYGLFPFGYRIKIFNKETLFAGKLHAVLCRDWSNYVKGRDYYDYIFYIRNNIKINLKYLESALKQTKHLSENDSLDIKKLKEMLLNKIDVVDFNLAKKDVIRFIKNPETIDIWDKDYFKYITNEYFKKNYNI